MDDVQTMRDRPKEKLRGRDRRSLNLSTKLTAVEARVIEDAATRALERVIQPRCRCARVVKMFQISQRDDQLPAVYQTVVTKTTSICP